MVYKLTKTVTVGDVKTSQLEFTDTPRVKHLLAMDTYRDGSVEQMIALVASLSNTAPAIIRELEPEDYAEVRFHANIVLNRFAFRKERPDTGGPGDPSKATAGTP